MSLGEAFVPCPLCGGRDARHWQREEQYEIVRCRACRLVYLANPPSEEALYEAYYAGSSADALTEAPSRSALEELTTINRQRLGAMQGQIGERLLDVGCGRGYFVREAATIGYEAAGVDVSQSAVAFAVRENGVEASCASLEDLARDAARFDVVTLWHVLEHFPDPVEQLRLIHVILKPGGQVFLEVPNVRSAKFILSGRRWVGGNHPRYHRTFHTAGTLRKMLEKAGFTEIRNLRLSYRLSGRSTAYEAGKALLNRVNMDAFLAFSARKG